ncbi:TIGR03084 family metal-binding protein [Nocardia aurantiaca]|uniref:TIGR03084 family protein n=1 Tax=Nocardia aurantiaca TaxID=2675850 RepID=A0A6I3L932_9NOCA|nr:TIGR03084 family metal-binding protein [Nocardia aurantiaca]MTE16756.1 TIGR03084 family protein [Nocardia aurantiaca]
MADLIAVLRDLAAESADLDNLVAGLDPSGWRTATPAEGWTIAHQIAHLAWADDFAALAATDADKFRSELGRGLAGAGVDEFVNAGTEFGARQAPAMLLARWRAGRERLAAALAAVAPESKLPWLGPSMSPASMTTARLMETWAHGQDVADALGVVRTPTARLRHVAHIGVRAMPYAFTANDKYPPESPVRVELKGPDGDIWSWGEPDALNRVTGPALDFCLLATQRRHREDLALVAEGPIADEWLNIAQAFAGPPGAGRTPGQFA